MAFVAASEAVLETDCSASLVACLAAVWVLWSVSETTFLPDSVARRAVSFALFEACLATLLAVSSACFFSLSRKDDDEKGLLLLLVTVDGTLILQ